MSEKPTLKKGILFLTLEKGLNGTVTILLIPIMIQTMGVESFGFWGILLGLMAYIHCMDCGVSLSIERYVAYYSTNNDYRSLEELLSTAFTMLLLLSFLLLFPCTRGP